MIKIAHQKMSGLEDLLEMENQKIQDFWMGWAIFLMN